MPHGGLPADAGAIVMNVTSVSTLGKFLKTGVPLTTKRVTVEGDAIAKPQNIEVPIGTLYRDVIEACGGIKPDVELGKIIFGGPMMGGASPSADYPVLKQNNGLLLFSRKMATLPEPDPCIRCGRCIAAAWICAWPAAAAPLPARPSALWPRTWAWQRPGTWANCAKEENKEWMIV